MTVNLLKYNKFVYIPIENTGEDHKDIRPGFPKATFTHKEWSQVKIENATEKKIRAKYPNNRQGRRAAERAIQKHRDKKLKENS